MGFGTYKIFLDSSLIHYYLTSSHDRAWDRSDDLEATSTERRQPGFLPGIVAETICTNPTKLVCDESELSEQHNLDSCFNNILVVANVENLIEGHHKLIRLSTLIPKSDCLDYNILNVGERTQHSISYRLNFSLLQSPPSEHANFSAVTFVYTVSIKKEGRWGYVAAPLPYLTSSLTGVYALGTLLFYHN